MGAKRRIPTATISIFPIQSPRLSPPINTRTITLTASAQCTGLSAAGLRISMQPRRA